MLAWQKRSYERQKLLEELKRELHEKEHETGKTKLDAALFLLLVAYLAARSQEPVDVLTFYDTKRPAIPFFNELEAKVRRFAKTSEEANVLMLDFLHDVLESFGSELKSLLHQQEVNEPERLYGGLRSTDKVEFEEK